MFKKLITLCGILLMAQITVQAQAVVAPTNLTDKKIMDGFMDLRFGMFISWAPVTLRGTEIGWSRGTQVSVKDYDNLYKEFDPVLFNADTWMKAAKDAGMKYLVLIAKHHGGFCMWPSAYTTYDIASTPYKKDVVGALAKACRKQGIKLFIYYSVVDWYYPDYPRHSYQGPVDPHADMGKYIVYMKNQLKEMITRYHPFGLWFDGNFGIGSVADGTWESPFTHEVAVDMYIYLKKLDPDIIINNRLGNYYYHNILNNESVGDFATPEQFVGPINMKYPWESNITIGKQWTWKPNDSIKSVRKCIDMLAGTAGGNGNLCLNVSPMLDGRMEIRTIDTLKEIGNWMRKYGSAIYSTYGGPYKPNEIFTSTRKGHQINILLLQQPQGVFTLANIPGCKVLSAHFMGGEATPFTQDHNGIHLTLAQKLPDESCSVIVLKLDKNADNIPLID